MQCLYPQSLSSDEYLRIWAGPCIAGTLPRSGRASTLLCLAPRAVSWIYLFCYTIYVGIPSKSPSVYIYTHMITLHIWLHVYIYKRYLYCLVGGLEHFLFLHILRIMIPIDSYFSEALKPPTSCTWDSWYRLRLIHPDPQGLGTETAACGCQEQTSEWDVTWVYPAVNYCNLYIYTYI